MDRPGHAQSVGNKGVVQPDAFHLENLRFRGSQVIFSASLPEMCPPIPCPTEGPVSVCSVVWASFLPRRVL